MLDKIGFISPQQSWFLLLFPVLLVLLWVFEKNRLKMGRQLGLDLKGSKFKLLIPALCILIYILALLRPYSGYQDVEVETTTSDLMLVVDVSQSMLTRDVAPNRLEFVKRKIFDLLNLLTNEFPGTRVGIVLFAGESYLFCPITTDFAVVKTFAQAIQVGLISSGGSALKSGLEMALGGLARAKARQPLILLMSDGEDLAAEPSNLSSLVSSTGARLSSLGFGTSAGRPIELDNGRFVKDGGGNIVVSKLNAQILEALATGAGGKFSIASLGIDDLKLLLGTARTTTTQTTSKIRVYHELGPLILLIPLIGILLLLATGRRNYLLIALLTIGMSRNEAHAQELRAGRAAYDAGEFEAANQEFEAWLKKEPGDMQALEALAASELKLGKAKEAAQHYDQRTNKASNARDKFKALYNSGTSYLAGKDYATAIDRLGEALKIKPGDLKAKHNLEVAKQLSELEKQNPTPTPQTTPKSDPQQNDQSKQNNAPAPTPTPQQTPEDKKDQDQQKSSQQDEQQREDKKDSHDDQKKDSKQSNSHEQANETPSSSETSTPSPESDSSQEKDESSSGIEEKKELPKLEITPLGSSEARAWLESLDESPVLLHRKQTRQRAQEGQTW